MKNIENLDQTMDQTMDQNVNQNVNQKVLNDINLDTSDKIYLLICSGILIAMLFTATKKKSLF
jgi:hypothetical protein